MVPRGQKLDDAQRLSDLAETGLLSVTRDSSFNRFVRLASRMMKVPVSLVSLVTDDKQHFVGSFGLDGELKDLTETPLSHSFCQNVVTSGIPLLVEDARIDERVKGNGAIEDLGVVSYMGVPIVSSKGNVLGSFCVIGGEPRVWSEDEVAFMEDLEAAVLAEIEMRRQTAHLQRTVQELKDAHVRNDEMIHMIIHDLRNPLAGVQGGVDLLVADVQEDSMESQVLEAMGEGCVQMMDMIGDILETSKLQNSEVPLVVRPLRIGPLLREISSQIDLLARSRSILMKWIDEDAPEEIVADRRLLKRLLQNLLINALKFSPAGGAVRLSVQSVEDGGMVEFAVSDSGPGIPASERESIFGKYVIGKNATARSIGLGLNFCRVVAEAHGGRVWVEEGVDMTGSTFRVRIPCEVSG